MNVIKKILLYFIIIMDYASKHALFLISLILIISVGVLAVKVVNKDDKMRKEKRKKQK